MSDYALAVSDEEIDRYRSMAEHTRLREAALWTMAGIRPGAVVADVGCGPGAVSAMLAEGLVTAADLERWEAAFARTDASPDRPTMFMPQFTATGRRPD